MEKTVGQRIMEVRTHFGHNQDVFSDKIGITQAALSRLESNAASPKSKTIHSICKAFNVRFNFLMNGEGEMLEVESSDLSGNWKEEAFTAVKSERDLLKGELNRVWGIVQHLTGGKAPDFLKAIKGTGLFYHLPKRGFNKSLIAQA